LTEMMLWEESLLGLMMAPVDVQEYEVGSVWALSAERFAPSSRMARLENAILWIFTQKLLAVFFPASANWPLGLGLIKPVPLITTAGTHTLI